MLAAAWSQLKGVGLAAAAAAVEPVADDYSSVGHRPYYHHSDDDDPSFVSRVAGAVVTSSVDPLTDDSWDASWDAVGTVDFDGTGRGRGFVGVGIAFVVAVARECAELMTGDRVVGNTYFGVSVARGRPFPGKFKNFLFLILTIGNFSKKDISRWLRMNFSSSDSDPT